MGTKEGVGVLPSLIAHTAATCVDVVLTEIQIPRTIAPHDDLKAIDLSSQVRTFQKGATEEGGACRIARRPKILNCGRGFQRAYNHRAVKFFLANWSICSRRESKVAEVSLAVTYMTQVICNVSGDIEENLVGKIIKVCHAEVLRVANLNVERRICEW
jgi:hypothetical protein